MEVCGLRGGRPFVGDETRESAGGGAIVGLLRGGAVLGPDDLCGSQTVFAILSTERPARPTHRVRAVEPEEGEPRRGSVDATRDRVVALEARRVADVDFTDLLGVVRDAGEVEGAGELDAPQGPPVLGEGLDAEGLAAREAVGVRR